MRIRLHVGLWLLASLFSVHLCASVKAVGSKKLSRPGCRLGELQRANVSDVDFESELLHVVRKGGKEDFVPMNEVVKHCIHEEFNERDQLHSDDPLFMNKHGKRYKRMTRSLRTACQKAGVPHCTHHSLRHAYATILHERGVDMGTISRLLGHANPTITQNIYVHWKDEAIKRAARKYSIASCWCRLIQPARMKISSCHG